LGSLDLLCTKSSWSKRAGNAEINRPRPSDLAILADLIGENWGTLTSHLEHLQFTRLWTKRRENYADKWESGSNRLIPGSVGIEVDVM